MAVSKNGDGIKLSFASLLIIDGKNRFGRKIEVHYVACSLEVIQPVDKLAITGKKPISVGFFAVNQPEVAIPFTAGSV